MCNTNAQGTMIVQGLVIYLNEEGVAEDQYFLVYVVWKDNGSKNGSPLQEKNVWRGRANQRSASVTGSECEQLT